MSLVRKKKESGGARVKTRPDSLPPISTSPPNPNPPSGMHPRNAKTVASNRKPLEQKENPAPIHSRRNISAIVAKDSVAPRSVSRGRGLSVRTNGNSGSPAKPAREKPRQIARSGVRIPGRAGAEDPKKMTVREEVNGNSTSLRWSTSSLPSKNGETGKKSSESSISRIISDLQRRSRVTQKNVSGVSTSHDGIECLGDKKPNFEPTKKENISVEKENPRVDLVGVGDNEKKGDKDEIKGSSFSSKLQERVAFLEGRVNQIASELRKTKEMLDANKTEDSMSMLSDIQVKISGIEKAITGTSAVDDVSINVVGDEVDKGQLGEKILKMEEGSEVQRLAEFGNVGTNVAGMKEGFIEKDAEKSSDSGVGSNKGAMKGLNHVELEQRLFPHQKLLRSRPSANLIKPKGNLPDPSNQNQSESGSFSHGEGVVHNSLSPIDENSIAAEFLTALNCKYSGSSDENSAMSLAIESGCASLVGGVIRPSVGAPISSGNGNEKVDSCTASDGGVSVEVIETDENEMPLECDEDLGFDDEENNQPCACVMEEIEEAPFDRMYQLGHKTCTAGWFVSESESILLAHDDGSCSFHDIANSEEKAEYKAPHGIAPNIWGDCWLIRAAGSDGRAGKYVVAASAGTTLDSGFCSWDFYSKEIVAFHPEPEAFTSPSSSFSHDFTERNVLGRNSSFANVVPESQHLWYRPCGPLLVATATSQKMVSVYDIRDGDHVMDWETQRNVTNMNFSSPLQWRNKGKVVVAETEAISLWDVNSLDPRPLHYVTFPGRKVTALHVHNTDVECNGGVRQRVSSSEAEGNDGVFCTQDAVNVFDFRVPSGIGLKIPTFGENGQSLFARGDNIFAGVVNTRFSSKAPVRCRVHQWSIRKGKPVCVYTFPDSNTHFELFSVAQVWGSSNLVMAINGNGLFIFDACSEDGANDHLRTKGMREVIGPDDLYCPSFDFSGSRILVVSKDRPAFWRYWS